MKDYFKIIGCIVLAIVIFSALGWILRPASMVADRVAMKHSFQYKEGMEQRAAILKSNIVELRAKMQAENDPDVVANMNAQLTMLNAQLRAITINN